MFDDDQYKDELGMGDDVFVIIGKEMAPNSKIPEAMFPLLEEFSDVFPDELPDALPPLCDIQHHIDLEPGSQFPNMPHDRISLAEHEGLRRQLRNWFLKDLHLNLPVLEVLAHALIYNTMFEKYVESLELGKNGSAFVQGEASAKIEDPELFTLPCRKDFLDCHLLGEWEIARDAEIKPFKDVLAFRRMVEFLGALPINHKGNMWESDD
nr:putative reverse transcriptase domain-containing protein [Tanacetum cinerariifolium]